MDESIGIILHKRQTDHGQKGALHTCFEATWYARLVGDVDLYVCQERRIPVVRCRCTFLSRILPKCQ